MVHFEREALFGTVHREGTTEERGVRGSTVDIREGSLIYGGFTRRISDRRRMDPLLFNVLAGVLSSLVFLVGMRGLVLHWEWFKWLCTKCRIRRSSRGVITQASQLVAEVQADALLLRFAPVVSVISRCVWISLSKLRRLVRRSSRVVSSWIRWIAVFQFPSGNHLRLILVSPGFLPFDPSFRRWPALIWYLVVCLIFVWNHCC